MVNSALRRSTWLAVLSVGAFCCTMGYACAEPVYLQYHLKEVAPGSFLIKTSIELGSEEGQAMLTAACTAFGLDCSLAAQAFGAYRAFTRDEGENHYDNIIPPEGYEVCKADYSGGIDSESTLSITYRHVEPAPTSAGPDGLSLYWVVPLGRKEGHSIDTNIDVMFVRSGEREKYNCLPRVPAIDLFNCKGGGPEPRMPPALFACK